MLKKIPEQIKRVSFLIAIILGGVLAARYFILPSSLVDTRFHRDSTVQREVARNVAFAGTTACGTCHADQITKKSKGYHKTVSCETCHGAARVHTEDPSQKPTAPKGREFCVFCHAYDHSRPTGFPQINPVVHNPLKSCTTCHNPHDPVPPETPRECSACHAQIASIKTASPHALIGCTTCHTVPAKHKISPRSVTPTKPETREFCGGCHAKEAPRQDAPKIDLSTHGERFLCWECHYPHLPERTASR
ncbi:MAG: hypothetical protein HY695_16120 [Deltaproteobacteria bacterium]|nr:hypothetical protein [Deltaproteobacteria bacterium]